MTIVVARRVRQVLETPLRTQPPVSAAGLLMLVVLALALVLVLVLATVMATVMAKVAAIPYAA